ncbi:hypothetical protein H8D83_01315 [Candidatus Woesearchaeota archaeon]|nr:hypothetical protein [Candidatus Woesearchaeota archaeon]MBL7051338.1 hypothetical protein [Candidatus Woesearchaeota archaeon]
MGKFDKLREQSILLVKKKLRESVHQDTLIIQTINAMEDFDKVANMLTTRLREWYSLYNPEFSEAIFNQEKFTELIIKKDKKTLLREINTHNSMGADLEKKDISAILFFAKQINELYISKKELHKYLESSMKNVCPNLLTLTGATLGAKLLAKAGSLKRLVMIPASTIQVLGAEKALFRHIKTGAKPPRHGIIIKHPLIASAKQSEHGKRARTLADKISIAVKVDYFKGKFIGDKLSKEIEEKFPKQNSSPKQVNKKDFKFKKESHQKHNNKNNHRNNHKNNHKKNKSRNRSR